MSYSLKRDTTVYFIDNTSGKLKKGKTLFSFSYGDSHVRLLYGFWGKELSLKRWEVFTLDDLKFIEGKRIKIGPKPEIYD